MDYVIHLGDYIYEYKNGDYGWGQIIGCVPLPDKEIYSLYDYRKYSRSWSRFTVIIPNRDPRELLMASE